MSGIKDATRAVEQAGSKKAGKTAEKTAEKQARKAHTRDSLQALSKLAEHVDGRYRIVSQPPVVIPLRDLAPRIGLSVDEMEHVIHEQFRAYRKTLQDDRRHLLERFEVVDMAHKVVGVGSVGTAGVHRAAAGSRPGRPVVLAGQGGDRVGSGRPPAEEPLPPSRASAWSRANE